ncbi:MAG: hypothetical protein A2X36_09005 [Elusimicrobia bacterium GWA2_69_24]|nr:MAG: hypothetical protein A2X36_09005 [Elusimicrobia bacterium GWA2_69_24]HBL18037.1 hypothetical protein [Elusimicrobiota bacterium]
MKPPRPLKPSLIEDRRRIDALDRALVRLLARRTRISCRLARLKASHGKVARDPARERVILAGRAAWAEARGLDPRRAAAVFRAVLALARAAQARSLRRQG